jgi:hypothetical protein
MAKVTVQLGEEDYRIVVGDSTKAEEGELVEYGQQATLDTPDAHYLCLIEDPDMEPEQVEVTVRMAGKAKQEPVADVEVLEVQFEDGDEDGDEFGEGDDEEEEEEGEDGDDEPEDVDKDLTAA